MNYHNFYKPSPSDFKYLWEDCKHCYWRKVKEGVQLPSIGMPKIFGKMNDLVQSSLLGMNLADIHPDLPSGRIEKKERYLKSIPVPNSQKAFISGRFDLLATFEDGTHGVIDLKITDPKVDSLYKFSTQLHAYKFALENPAEGLEKEVEKISKMGLLVMSPSEVEFKNGKIIFHAKPHWIPFDEKMNEFFNFVDEIAKFLEGPMPEPSQDCAWCRYRALTHPIQTTDEPEDDIPF
jgi:CRISPR/Cas system-associated exonuclease Cas4 (RecB family)